MRTGTSLLEATPTAESGRVEGALRILVSLVESTGDRRQDCQENSAGPEEVLIDVELDGTRYLLVRMPPPMRNRVQLSPREQEIVRMVAQGHPNKVIADVLNISSWTVCTHLRRIFAKLGVSSRAAMVAQLLDLGTIAKEYRPAFQR
jgi:DNA-binding CsgD family transcriptional regulator